MAAIILLKRATAKAHLTSVIEGTDDAVLSSVIRTASGPATAWNDAFTTSITIGGSVQTTGTLFGGVAMTTLNVGTGMGSGDTINVGGTGSTTVVAGNLVVNGTTTSVDSEVVNVADNHLYLNAGYTTVAAQTGGLVVNYLPTATADTSNTGGFATATTVNTVGAATFAAGDFVQISGALVAANEGIYEVLTHAANVLTIDSTPVHDFVQSGFTVSTGDTTAVITKINISAIRSGTDGVWETGFGSTAGGLVFSDLSTAGGVSLQTAYNNSTSPATITTNSTDDEILITGTAGLRVTGTGADNTVSAGFGFEVDTIGAYRLLGDVASTISTTGANLTLSTVTSGTLAVTSVNALDMDAGAAGATLDTTGSFSVDGAGASNVSVTGADLTLSTITTGALIATSAGLWDLNAGANLDIDVTGTYDMLSTSTFSIDGTGASNVSATSGTLTISTITSGDVTVSAVSSVNVLGAEAAADAVRINASNVAGGIDVDAGTAGVLVDTTGSISLDAAVASNLTTSSGDLTLSATGNSVVITGAEAAVDAVQINASNGAGGIDVNAGTGGITVDTTAALSLDSTGTASNLTLTATSGSTATLLIEVTNGGAGTGVLDINADDAITLDSTAAGISLDAATASNFTVSGATADLTLGARASTITLNQVDFTIGSLTIEGQTLDVAFTATSIIGGLNELKAVAGSAYQVKDFYTTTGRTVGQPVIADGNASAATAADATVLSTSEGFVGIVLTVGGAGVGEVVTQGRAVSLFAAGVATPVAGDPVYLSETTGRVTPIAPSGTPNSGIIIFPIGVVKDTTSTSGGTGLTAGTIGANETCAILLQPMQLIEL
jgi:hypothetical protein